MLVGLYSPPHQLCNDDVVLELHILWRSTETGEKKSSFFAASQYEWFSAVYRSYLTLFGEEIK